ncbi:MAG: S-methyl-5'-thioadenosine phosphorylase, partial [Cyanobacteria bacterium]|nr:S-methyl-5'-thioadenosine phosphorylase [Cyanobacteriota bacterium]
VNISLITDYDCGLIGNVEPVSHSEVVKVFNQNNEKLVALLIKLAESIPEERANCTCSSTLESARLL